MTQPTQTERDEALEFFNAYLKMTGLTDQTEQRRIVEGLHRKAHVIKSALSAPVVSVPDRVINEAYNLLKWAAKIFDENKMSPDNWRSDFQSWEMYDYSAPDVMPAMDGWLPIESAPRDGTPIIIMEKDGDVRKAYFAKGDGSHACKGWLTHPWNGGVQPLYWQPYVPPTAQTREGE